MSSSTMSDRLIHLRFKIKAWERDFAASNEGKTPTRDDINNNDKIASRYKEYRKLQKQEQREKPQESIDVTPSLKTRSTMTTPRKLLQSAAASKTTCATPQTDRTSRNRSASLDNETWYTTTRDYIDPTPQRNGRVLGIFESLISPASKRAKVSSPLKRKLDAKDSVYRDALSSNKQSVASPIRRRSDHLSTPSKRRMVDALPHDLQTPTALRTVDYTGVSELFATPAMFRERHVPTNLGTSPGLSSSSTLRPRLPPVRGLSSLLAEMRQVENEAIDADAEEAMREVEMDGQHIMPLQEDSMASVTMNAPETVSKPWKKKGLKRQTKRFKIRPVKQTLHDAQSSVESQSTAKLCNNSANGNEENQLDDFDDSTDLSDLDDVLKQKQGLKPSKQPDSEYRKPSKRSNAAQSNQNYRRLKIKGKERKANTRKYSRKR